MARPDDVDKLLDEMLKGRTPEETLGQDGVLKGLTKRLVERALEGERTAHLGYPKHAPEGRGSGNSRNGATDKRVLTGEGELDIEVPRDRNGEFEPQLVKKGQRRRPGFDDKVIALYARGLTTREIQGHLVDIYGVEVSPTLISNVTDAVLEDVRAWQGRPLDAVYPILYLVAIHLRLRSSGAVQNQAVIRKAIYTTNAIESIHASLRKVTRKRGAFPNPESVRKVLYLAILKASEHWARPIKDWAAALNHFTILFEGRVTNR
jgi:transposase-like protein